MDAVPIVFQLEIRCEAKLILARVGKKQCPYFVVAWPNVQTLSLLLHSKYIWRTRQDERYECEQVYQFSTLQGIMVSGWISSTGEIFWVAAGLFRSSRKT